MLPRRDIIVIGASAGGVEALQALVAMIPNDLAASIFIVLHMTPWSHSQLPQILNYNGNLPALYPTSAQAIEAGRIFIAPPDYHMILEKDRIKLWRGPKENMHRPAVNPLFRSAAVNYKKRVVGIILSGTLDEGSAGLWWVKDFGGLAVVQDPREAKFPDMPQNAMKHVAVDHILDLEGIAALLREVTVDGSPVRKMRGT
jgi:two-component system chemotaxis response regulator CheB